MEKMCEFCTALRPVVYCKADAAHLCLSCDARVHSANALSGRHFRTLLCQSCRNRPAYARCVDHEMFICRNCDRSLHGFSSKHQKQLLRTYTECPSPKDFAVLWGFDTSLLENTAGGDRFVSSSTEAMDKGVMNLRSQKHPGISIDGSSAMAEACSSASAGYSKASQGSSSQQRRINQRVDPQQGNSDILQQILGLKKMQLTEQKGNPSLLLGKEQAEYSRMLYETSQNLEENLDRNSQLFPDISDDLQAMDISQVLKEEPSTSPFSQLEHLNSPAGAGLTTGDTSWQWKSPAVGSQLWSQNMEDLGVCEEFDCFDDIPDVDSTFQNFEELFGGDHTPTGELIEGEDASLSAFENTASLDKSDGSHTKSFEGASAASSENFIWPPHPNKEINLSGHLKDTEATADSPNIFIRQFSLSRLGEESSLNDSQDTGASPITFTGEPSSNPGTTSLDIPQTGSPRFNDKRKAIIREKEKQNRYSPQKSQSSLKKRAKDHFLKPGSHQTGSFSAARSY